MSLHHNKLIPIPVHLYPYDYIHMTISLHLSHYTYILIPAPFNLYRYEYTLHLYPYDYISIPLCLDLYAFDYIIRSTLICLYVLAGLLNTVSNSIWRYLNQRLVVYSIERKPVVGVNGYLQKIVIENDDRLIKHSIGVCDDLRRYSNVVCNRRVLH